MNEELEKLLIIGIGQLMMGDSYPNVDQIVAKIRPLIAARDTAIRIDELEKIAPARYKGLPTTDETDSIKLVTLERKILDRLASLRGKGEAK